MNEKTRSWFVIFSFVALAVIGYTFFLKPYMKDQPQLDRVLRAKSTWAVTMQVYRHAGPVASETYRISNDDGAVRIFYSATSRDGVATKQFNVPISGYTGTFLFEQLRADGIWELDDKPARQQAKEEYIVEVEQSLGDEGGSRAFTFTDPRYWATTKAQEIQIRLPAHSMKKLNLSNIGSAGRSLREPRYLKIVQEIRGFGPASVQQAEDLIRSELADYEMGRHVTQARARKKGR